MKIKFKLLVLMGVILLSVFLSSRIIIPTFGNYSDGGRSGILQKFSKKGFIIKTYEGELAMEGVKGSTNVDGSAISSIFNFSVKDENIAKRLDSLLGKNVTLTYKQVHHVNIFDGESDYFITDVKENK